MTEIGALDLLSGGGGITQAALSQALRALGPLARARLPEFSYEADELQAQFIEEPADLVRLIAPAGSGKTQSIANRVLKEIAGGRDPRDYLLLTFDNAAASTLRGRLQAEVKKLVGEGAGQVAVQTLNSFGFQLMRGPLQPHIGTLSMGEDPAKDASAAVGTALEALKKEHPDLVPFLPNVQRRAYVGLISGLKNGLVIPSEIARQERTDSQERLARLLTTARVFEPWLMQVQGRIDEELWARRVMNFLLRLYIEYCAIMAGASRLDFDDQKLLPYLKLRGDQRLVDAAMGRVRTVIVDEFQDINTLDFELIRTLVGGRQLVVVGDDDQAIYGFRGCSPDYIIDLDKHLGREVRTHVLEVNYRCPRNIVEKSQRLIRNNTRRIEKRARAAVQQDAAISLWQCANSAAEAQVIASAIRKLHDQRAKDGFEFKDAAILIRVNSQSLPIQLALATENIPYMCRKEDNILLSDAMKNLIGLLRLSVELGREPSYVTREACRLILRCYFRYIRDADVTVFERAGRTEGGLLQAAMALVRGEQHSGARFTANFADAVGALYRSDKPEVIVRKLGEKFRHLGGLVGTLEDALDDTAPLGEMLEIASRFTGSTAQLVGRLEGLLRQVEGAKDAKREGDGVNILSYFRAKGRQWDTVFLPSVNQRVIPHARAPIEDERRLFYVAITRVSANLFLSFTRSIVRSPVEASQFLAEIGMGPATEKRALRS